MQQIGLEAEVIPSQADETIESREPARVSFPKKGPGGSFPL